MSFADLSPVWQENVTCVLKVAQERGLPANVLLAIASLENGRPGLKSRNNNGSYDLGKMQVNTIHLTELGRYGIKAEHLLAPGCYSIELAGWMLARHLAENQGDFWTRAANYHSKTPHYNTIYKTKLISYANAWGDWLASKVPTVPYPTQQGLPVRQQAAAYRQAQPAQQQAHTVDVSATETAQGAAQSDVKN